MLHPDKAREQLEKWENRGVAARRTAALQKLPSALAAAGLALLGRKPDGKANNNWQSRNKVQAEAIKFLEERPKKDRERIFAALLPKMGAALEAGWRLMQSQPYQVGYDRKAFRAPRDPEVTRSRRFEWLETILEVTGNYDLDVVEPKWLAAWGSYVAAYHGADEVGYLLAAVINEGGKEGEEVLEILKDSAKGEHDISSMGRHVSRALMTCARPDAWEFMEKMLLAAQRQEGLRQVILESIDECHPEAFRRMIKLILDENLIRFSSVVRAVDVWLSLEWDSATPRVITDTLKTLQTFLTDATAREAALHKGSGEDVFLALWALAHDDARDAIKPARALLQDKGLERRFAAILLLSRLHHTAAIPALREAVQDEDLRISITAFNALPMFCDLGDDVYKTEEDAEQQFKLVEELLGRMPEKAPKLKPLIWPWATVDANPQHVADQLVVCLGKQPLKKLFPYLPRMSRWGRCGIAERLSKLKNWDAQTRTLMFDLVNDRDSAVRHTALFSLKKAKITPEEAERLEVALKRKSSDTRRAVLSLLLKLPAEALHEASERLLTSKNPNQRLAGLEMLRLQVESNKRVETCRNRARQYQADHATLSDEEGDQLESILDTERSKYNLENGLGLLDVSKLTPTVAPKVRKVSFFTSATVAVLKALDDLLHLHRDHTYEVQVGETKQTYLLGSNGLPWTFQKVPIKEDVKRLPLLNVWENWYAQRPKNQRDADGLELLRATMLPTNNYSWDDWSHWKNLGRKPAFKSLVSTMLGGVEQPPKIRYQHAVEGLLGWLLRLHPPERPIDWMLDATETVFALVPETERTRILKPNKSDSDWRNQNPFQLWMQCANQQEGWTDEQKLRRWQLLHWQDQPAPGVLRSRPNLDVLLDGYRQRAATEDDLLDDMLGPRGGIGYWNHQFNSLRTLTQPKPHEILSEKPEVGILLNRCRERILEIELKRGDTETAATGPAGGINSLWGVDTLARLLNRLGTRGLRKSYYGYGNGKVEVLTHLIAVTFPKPGEGLPEFTQAIKPLLDAYRITQQRLLELAFLAPQWLSLIAGFMQWQGLEEGVWWFFAHINEQPPNVGDDQDEDEDEDDEDQPTQRKAKLSLWERMLQERTTLTAEDRRDGAVDVDWFRRVCEPLQKKHWEALAAAAKCAGRASAAKKAFHLSQVILGKAKKRDLVRDIRVRNLRESVRLLGLLPLASGEKREADLINRYEVLQGYRRYAKSLGPMSKEGALRTASIGLENMARTAGYPDPIRFEWAMEAREIADLAQGPLSHTADGVTVTLTLDALAAPEVTIMRGDKPLKQIPPKVRKDRKIAAIVDRKADLRRQASRVRESLERMMCKGDTFTGAELQQLHQHPMLVPLLSRLVLLGDGTAGYPVKDGKGLRHHSGKVEPVKATEILRIAHAHDLLTGGEWPEWQRECFTAERVQPFKQVFRELYVLTAQEKKDGYTSQRYAGQQVNPTQGQALFGARAWGTREGIEKTFHEAGVVAQVYFRYGGFTPLEVEGWTFESVVFRKRNGWEAVALKDVPPKIFSEVMRDVDLVVSVAHRGGVDPEASASTVEMRAALLRETCQLLSMNNVRIKDNHVLIAGQLGEYSVHLGSAVVHRQPGGHLCIVPVHGQHRGRLFLPFADDDPRTAEVITKVIMLARDQEIQDPNILDQIRAPV